MKNNFVLIGEETNYFLIDFLKKKEVFFVKYDESQNYEEGQVFFFSFNIEELFAKKEIEENKHIKKRSLYYIAPSFKRSFYK